MSYFTHRLQGKDSTHTAGRRPQLINWYWKLLERFSQKQGFEQDSLLAYTGKIYHMPVRMTR